MGLDHRSARHARDRVGVEIALLDAALADGDLAEQSRREAIEHRAFDLHRGGERIDQMAAIDARDDAPNLDLAAIADRDLGDRTPPARISRMIGGVPGSPSPP